MARGRIRSLGSITPKDIPKAQISNKELIQEIESIFTEETLGNEKNPLKKIGEEGKKILVQLKKFEEWFTTVQKRLQSNIKDGRTRAAALRKLYIDKQLFYWEALLKKAYIFIQKTRNYITNEKLEYIIYFDESLSGGRQGDHSEDKIGVFSLEQILSLVSLDIKAGDQEIARLKLNRQQDMRKLYDSLGEMEQWQKNIIKNFEKILSARRKRYQEIKNDSTLSKTEKKERLTKAFTSRGFAAEAAITLIQETNDIEELIKAYKQDNDAFWRGGDLQQAVDSLPQELLKQYEQTNFEVKRLSATAEKSAGAGLVTLKGLITALTTIVNIFTNSKLTEAQMRQFISSFLFKANKNISEKVANSIAEVSADALNKIFEEWEK